MRWLERWFENGLFAARWLLAPFYAGLAIAMLLLLAVFARELWAAISGIAVLNTEAAIVKLLTLLDLALVASLVVVVVLAGYENFISKIDTEGHEDRPGWMGTTSFGGPASAGSGRALPTCSPTSPPPCGPRRRRRSSSPTPRWRS